MWGRQKTGSVICRSCGGLVSVSEPTCFYCGARNPGLFGFAAQLREIGADLGFGYFILGFCILCFGLTLALDPEGITNRGLNLLSPSIEASVRMGASGIYPVWENTRWWTVLSAGWLHGSLLHIFFNMQWMRVLVPQVAELYGPGRTVVIWVLSSVAGFLLSSTAPLFILQAAPSLEGPMRIFPGVGLFTLGASAAITGMWGALIHYGRRTGSAQLRHWVRDNLIYLVIFGVAIRGIDNWAHLGGFIGGWVVAKILDPLKPERTDHILMAIGLLALSVLSVAASLMIAAPPLR